MRIVLIGYRGTGKTTVGRLLAGRLAWPFVDTDPLIEEKAGMTIAEIFRRFGEQRFRDMESEVIAGLDSGVDAVISVGGGAILREENTRRLRESAMVVWLTAAAETLHGRIGADVTTRQRRPELTTLAGLDEIRHLLAVREPLYQAASDVRVDTQDRSAEEIVETILTELARRR